MVTDSESVFQKLSEQFHDGKEVPFLSDAVRAELIKNVQRRMTPQPLKIRADVELTCYAYDGVLHIQARSHWGSLSVHYLSSACNPPMVGVGETPRHTW